MEYNQPPPPPTPTNVVLSTGLVLMYYSVTRRQRYEIFQRYHFPYITCAKPCLGLIRKGVKGTVTRNVMI
jgi:hypothetical protein